MTKPVATLILQRNLPEYSDAIGDHLLKWNGDVTDVYVIESGSDPDKLSKYSKFWANWPDAVETGLRYPRGFNYGLLELDKAERYDFYFMVTGDAFFFPEPTIPIMLEEMYQWPKFGIMTPISPDWGEYRDIPLGTTKCHWLLPHIAWLIRSEFLERIKEKDAPTYMNYFYDGDNFRGYDADTEVGIKAYLNDYALAVTAKARMVEQIDLYDQNADIVRTDRRKLHNQLMLEEALAWMKKKYNFDSKWEMRAWAKMVYGEFFDRNREYERFKL